MTTIHAAHDSTSGHTSRRRRVRPATAMLFAVLFGSTPLACDDSDDANSAGARDDMEGGSLRTPTGEGPCDEADECEGNVCVAIATDSPPLYCSESCEGGCPDGFYCDTSTFALVGLEFCRIGADEPPAMPEPPPEPPRLPCTEDDDCEGDAVCAIFKGESECTIPCSQESDCDLPSAGGITIDLVTCGTDERVDRTVCLPDLSCFPDYTGCVSGF